MANQFTVTTQVLRPYVTVGDADTANYALVSVKAPVQGGATQRATAIVLDVSGSMNESMQGSTKIEWAKYAVREIVDLATADDTIVLVLFSSSAATAFGPAVMDANGKAQANAAVDRIRAGGGTYMSLGLREAFRGLQGVLQGRVGRIIFFTDGQNDSSDARPLQEFLQSNFYANEQSIPISTYGVGETYNEVLLREIADRTRGNTRYIKDSQELVNNLTQEFQETQGVAITNAALQLTVIANVQIGQVSQVFPAAVDLQVNRIDERNVRISLPNLGSEEERDFLIGFSMPPQATTGKRRPGFLQISYDMPGGGAYNQTERPDGGQVFVEFTEDRALAAQVNVQVDHYAGELRKADLIKQAVVATQTGRLSGEQAAQTGKLLDEARQVTGKLLSQAQQRGDSAATAKLQGDMAAIEQMQSEVRQGEVSSGTRKLAGDQTRGTTRLS
ncbi:MAG TPA: VWA domain-containing protein [Dehalococcoidia bacterium]